MDIDVYSLQPFACANLHHNDATEFHRLVEESRAFEHTIQRTMAHLDPTQRIVHVMTLSGQVVNAAWSVDFELSSSGFGHSLGHSKWCAPF